MQSRGDLLNEKFQGITKPIYDFSKAFKPAMDIFGGTGIEIMEFIFSEGFVPPTNEKINPKKNTKDNTKINLKNNKFKG